jgi:Spy/CpxP family protein refolding chaperone
MKRFTTLSVALIAVTAPLLAQDNPSMPGGAEQQPGSRPKHQLRKQAAAQMLTSDERARLEAAEEKAKNDPTVRSLREAKESLEDQLANAMRAAMVAADPTLAPTLDKIRDARGRAKGMRDRYESLTPEQREQLKSARSIAKDDPAVVAAREAMKSADSPEARRAAGKAMHEAMKAAMTKQDPGLAALLEKLGPPPGGPGRPGGPGGPAGGPMGPPPGMEDGLE